MVVSWWIVAFLRCVSGWIMIVVENEERLTFCSFIEYQPNVHSHRTSQIAA